MTAQEKNSLTKTSSMEVTDVNIDCLEYVFEYLNTGDVVNVANGSSWMRKGASRVFAHKLRNKTVILKDISNFSGMYFQPYRRGFEESADRISIGDLKKSLQFLRCFGHLIFKLEISYLLVDEKYQTYINQYVSAFCTESLVEITFASCSGKTFADLRKTFTNVEKVRFVNCNLGDETRQLNDWFPNLRSLEFDGFNEVSDRACIATQFPHLEHLATNLSVTKGKFGFGEENVSNAIKMNPNLRSLHIHWDFNRQFLKGASNVLQNLHTFQIDCFCEPFPLRLLNEVDEDEELFSKSIIRFDSVKDFRLHLNSFELSANKHRVPFKFDALKNFTFQSDERIGELFFDFIHRHPSITKLTLKNIREWHKTNLSEAEKDRITDKLPSLTDVDITSFEFTGRQALRFVNKSKTLKRFRFTLECPTSFVGLMERLPGWRGQMDAKHCVTLNRAKKNF